MNPPSEWKSRLTDLVIDGLPHGFLLLLTIHLGYLFLFSPKEAKAASPVCGHHYQQPAAVLVPTAIPFTFVTYSKPDLPTREDLAKRLSALEKEVQSLRSGASPKKIPADHRPAVQKKCHTCHDSGSARELGGGFVLPLDPGELSAAKRQRLVTKVVSGDMPPDGKPPLDPSEADAITSAYSPSGGIR